MTEAFMDAGVIPIQEKGYIRNLYQTVTRIITNIIIGKIDHQKPREHAGFRSRYITHDQI